MELYEFNQLKIDLKAEFAWANGFSLEAISFKDCSFLLYWTKNFYVEFEFEKGNISEIRGFKRGIRLEKYLDKIDLKLLLEEKED